MTIDKWLNFDSNKNKKKIDEKFNKLSEKEVNELKKKQIRKVIQGKNYGQTTKEKEPADFLSMVIEFKRWLNLRTYLKGDMDKIEVWVRNLSTRLNLESSNETKSEKKSKRLALKEGYSAIPPNFLEDKTRIAMNKKLNGQQLTASDHYYLRKLKQEIQLKLKEAKYYDILNNILKM